MPADRDLMRRIVQRDASAFDALFARHGPTIRLRLVSIVRDEAAADDLLQEVFLRLWTRAEQWDGRGELRAWLGRIATNLALNHLRSGRRRRQRPLEVPAHAGEGDEEGYVPGWMIDEAAVGPDAAAELAERLEFLGRLVADLPEGKREVLRLVHEEDKNLGEAAEQLGIPVGTVKSRLHYALKRLFEQWHEIEGDWENL